MPRRFTDSFKQMGWTDREYGMPFDRCDLMVQEHRDLWEAGWMAQDAYIKANAHLREMERERAAKRKAAWEAKLNPKPASERKGRKRHEHGKDW